MKRIIIIVLILLLLGCTSNRDHDETQDNDVSQEINENDVKPDNHSQEKEHNQVVNDFYEIESISFDVGETISRIIKGNEQFFYVVSEKQQELTESGQLPNPSDEIYKVDSETHEMTLVKEVDDQQIVLDLVEYLGHDYAMVLQLTEESHVTVRVIKDFLTENETIIDEYPYFFYSTNGFKIVDDELYYIRHHSEVTHVLIKTDGQQTEEITEFNSDYWFDFAIDQDNLLMMSVYQENDHLEFTLSAYYNDEVIEEKLPYEAYRLYPIKDRILMMSNLEENMTEVSWYDLMTQEIISSDINYQIDGFKHEYLTKDTLVVYEQGKKFDIVHVNDDYEFEITELPELKNTFHVTKLTDNMLLLDLGDHDYKLLKLNQ